MKVIILAAGKGKRLGNLTDNQPKCMLKLGNETILQREIRILKNCGIAEKNIFVVGGYKYEVLKKDAPNLIINTEFESKDNAYSLGLALKSVNDDDVLIMDADLCFEEILVQEILNDARKNVLLSRKSDDLKESTGIVTAENGRVKAIGKTYKNTGYVYISIFKIDKNIIPEFRELLLSERSKKTWYPLAITELCEKYEFYNHSVKDRWHEIDFYEDYIETLNLFELGETE